MMNEGTGTTLTDSSGNGNHGTINGATWSGDGYEFYNVVLDGSSATLVTNKIDIENDFTINSGTWDASGLGMTVGGSMDNSGGIFIDGIVEGVEYSTNSGINGLTSKDGRFSYQTGDDITFKVGGVLLGTATAEDVALGKTFLQDIANVDRTDLNDEHLENMATFLQSLDENRDADDGIVITEEKRTALLDADLDLRKAAKEEVQQLVESVGGVYVNEEDAMDHVKEMLIQFAGMEEGDFEAHVVDDSGR